jgi:hypothetical protein
MDWRVHLARYDSANSDQLLGSRTADDLLEDITESLSISTLRCGRESKNMRVRITLQDGANAVAHCVLAFIQDDEVSFGCLTSNVERSQASYLNGSIGSLIPSLHDAVRNACTIEAFRSVVQDRVEVREEENTLAFGGRLLDQD